MRLNLKFFRNVEDKRVKIEQSMTYSECMKAYLEKTLSIYMP